VAYVLSYSPCADMPLFLQDTSASRYWPSGYVANIVPTSVLYALNLLFRLLWRRLGLSRLVQTSLSAVTGCDEVHRRRTLRY
jgi:hypothetical protein